MASLRFSDAFLAFSERVAYLWEVWKWASELMFSTSLGLLMLGAITIVNPFLGITLALAAFATQWAEVSGYIEGTALWKLFSGLRDFLNTGMFENTRFADWEDPFVKGQKAFAMAGGHSGDYDAGVPASFNQALEEVMAGLRRPAVADAAIVADATRFAAVPPAGAPAGARSIEILVERVEVTTGATDAGTIAAEIGRPLEDVLHTVAQNLENKIAR